MNPCGSKLKPGFEPTDKNGSIWDRDQGTPPMDLRTFFGRLRDTPFHLGQTFERIVADRLRTLVYRGSPFVVAPTAGAGDGTDVPTTWNDLSVGWECKTKNAFEGGSRKLVLKDGRLVLEKDGLHKQLLGDTVLFGGAIPRFLYERPTSWSREEAETFKDQHIPIASDAVAQYYAAKGTHYIVVEGRGVYRTGVDILELGVPLFECPMDLRVRTSKHRKKLSNGTRVPTDAVVDINYKARLLPPTPFTLFPAE